MKTILFLLSLLSLNATAAALNCHEQRPLKGPLEIVTCKQLQKTKGKLTALSAEACLYTENERPLALTYIINDEDVNRFYFSSEQLKIRDYNGVTSWKSISDYPNFLSHDTYKFEYHGQTKRLRIRMNPAHFPRKSTIDITLLCY